MSVKQKARTFFGDVWALRKFLLLNLVALVAITFIIIQIILFGLSIYTQHGESIEVPDLVNMKVEEADQLLATRQLEFIVSDSICKGNMAGGLIREQNPRPGHRVKENRTIYLTVNRYSPCTVNLYYNQLIGRSRKMVVKTLQKANLKVGKLTYRPGGKAENTVVEASINGVPLFIEADFHAGERPPKEAKKVPQNAVIDLVLLEGIDALPQYAPNLQCSTYGEAEFIIKGKQFNMGQVHTTGTITDTLGAYIWQQRPYAGNQMTMGAGIDIWIVQDRPQSCDEEEVFDLDD